MWLIGTNDTVERVAVWSTPEGGMLHRHVDVSTKLQGRHIPEDGNICQYR
jgi:hypothetical protein